MIEADYGALEARLRKTMYEIREKELDLYSKNFGVLGTKSAFLCGLGYSGLLMVPAWQRSSSPGKAVLVAFYTLDSLSICFNLATITLSSWCIIFGPSLAIRGPTGSMSRSVSGMQLERRVALRFFWAGNFFLLLASVALGWCKFDQDIATCITIVFFFFVVLSLYYISQVTKPLFTLPKTQIPSLIQTQSYSLNASSCSA